MAQGAELRAMGGAAPVSMMAARELLGESVAQSGWSMEALSGRFVELVGSASLTASFGLVVEVQKRGDLAVWIGGHRFTFYPPDAAAAGVDLKALPVIQVDEESQAWQASDTLLHSGAFALVVVDLGGPITVPISMQTRLVGLAKRHHTILLIITRNHRGKPAPGSLVSLRAETATHRIGHDCFTWELWAVKDKRGAVSRDWRHSEICRGPDGLC
jgi:recombination protein RecA